MGIGQPDLSSAPAKKSGITSAGICRDDLICVCEREMPVHSNSSFGAEGVFFAGGQKVANEGRTSSVPRREEKKRPFCAGQISSPWKFMRCTYKFGCAASLFTARDLSCLREYFSSTHQVLHWQMGMARNCVIFSCAFTWFFFYQQNCFYLFILHLTF